MSAIATRPANAAPNLSKRVDASVLDTIESIVQESNLATISGAGHFAKAFKLANGIRRLREMMNDEVMGEIMPLMNTALGFKTDRDPARPQWSAKDQKMVTPRAYPVETVRECLIEGLLRGAFPVGNELNIISERAYLTKEFYTRKLGELPGVSNVRSFPGVPQMSKAGDGALMPFKLTWTRDGRAECVDRTGPNAIPIRVNKQMGADAIIGKATRKIYKQAYEQITGSALTADDDSDDVVMSPSFEAANKAKQLESKLVEPTADAPHPEPESQEAIDPETGVVLGVDIDDSAHPDDDVAAIDLYAEAFEGKGADERKRVLVSAAKDAGIGRAAIEGWIFKHLQPQGLKVETADVPALVVMLKAIKSGKLDVATGGILD